MSGKLEGRIALITGASRGIGAAVAKAYAGEGAQLILTARTVGGLEEVATAIAKAGGLPPLVVPLDLLKSEAINQLGALIFEKFGRLDVLVANAASLGVLGPLAQSDAKKFERTLALNLTANYHLIRAMDPLLRASPSGAAIFVSSGVTRSIMPYWGAYSISKLGLEQLAQLYAAETATSRIKVHVLDPGVVRTAMRAEAFPGEDPATLPTPESIAAAFIEPALASNSLSSGGRIEARSLLKQAG